MILSDRDIRERLDGGDLVVDPLSDHQIQPGSIDLTLGSDFYIPNADDRTPRNRVPLIDPCDPEAIMMSMRFRQLDYVIIHPNSYVLGTTRERVELPADLSGVLYGRSSIGRLGVIIHTAGWVDAGYEGELTLEIANHNSFPIILHAGMRVCQLVLEEMTSPAERPYGHEGVKSKYQGQRGVTLSRVHEDEEMKSRKAAKDAVDARVPEGVLRGIEDVAAGRTASKEDIERVLKDGQTDLFDYEQP